MKNLLFQKNMLSKRIGQNDFLTNKSLDQKKFGSGIFKLKKSQRQAELGVPHSRSKFSGPNQNCCQTPGLVLRLWVDFVLSPSKEEEEQSSPKSECTKSLKLGI